MYDPQQVLSVNRGPPSQYGLQCPPLRGLRTRRASPVGMCRKPVMHKVSELLSPASQPAGLSLRPLKTNGST